MKSSKTKGSQMKRTESVAFCGLSIALLAISAQITVSFGPVPFTLQTMMITFVFLLLPAREALISIFGYLILGALGVPVFAGLSGGVSALMGATGGFIYGFGLGAICAVLLLKTWKPAKSRGLEIAREASAALVLLVVCYLFGWIQLMIVADMGPLAAFGVAIAPFVVFDLAKAGIAVALAHTIRQAVPVLRNAQAAR